MKKLFSLFTAATLLSLVFTSCEKKDVESNDDVTITQTENVSLKMNEAYTFTLPSIKSDDAFQIVTPASHALVSLIGKDLMGNFVYQYTPAKDYTGKDIVILSTVEENHTNSTTACSGNHDHGNHHGEHGNHMDEQETIITINFIIENSVVTKAFSGVSVH